MNAQILEFDTNLAGFKVAKILPCRLSASELITVLAELKRQGVHLVYWLADSGDAESNQIAIKQHGFLASQHITYLIDLANLNLSELTIQDQYSVELYQEQQSTVELEQLALTAGSYSHFNIDPQFPRELFLKIYHEWIKNSVNKSIANDIVIIKSDNKVVAMATLGVKNQRGDIGLLAVDANFRGKNFGTKIVKAAQWYFITNGFKSAQVVTQVINGPARHLYEKCGFKPERVDNFYHFWLL